MKRSRDSARSPARGGDRSTKSPTLIRAERYAILTAAALAVGLLVSRAAEVTTVPEQITLTPYNRTAGVVTFTHKDHGSMGEKAPNCAFCHHTTPWDRTPEKCSNCHKAVDEAGVPGDETAFHKLCVGCHSDEINRGNKRLTLRCDACHASHE
jgi:formate dehydrogenase maturation protein FdhE